VRFCDSLFIFCFHFREKSDFLFQIYVVPQMLCGTMMRREIGVELGKTLFQSSRSFHDPSFMSRDSPVVYAIACLFI